MPPLKAYKASIYLPLAVFLANMAAVILLYKTLSGYNQDLSRNVQAAAAASLKSGLEARLQGLEGALSALGRIWSDPGREEDIALPPSLQNWPGLVGAGWVDSTGAVRGLAAESHYEVRRWTPAGTALPSQGWSRGKLNAYRPHLHGDTGALYLAAEFPRTPRHGRGWAFVALLEADFLHSAVGRTLPEGYTVEVRDASGKPVFLSSSGKTGNTPSEEGTVQRPGLEWRIRLLAFRGGFPDASGGLHLAITLSIGLLLSGLLATTLFFFQRASMRALESEGARLNLLREIDRRKAAEAQLRIRSNQLEAANKELEAFNYSVSHDLRAPLRCIDGFSKSLLMHHQDSSDEKGRNYLIRIRTASQRMSLLIEALLNLSHANRDRLNRVRVDITAIARRILIEFREQEPGRRMETTVQDGLTVFGDLRLVEDVLQNLLGNAWKFTSAKEDAAIEVGSAIRDGESILFVRDNGAGFDMAYARKLFGVFQRLHSPSEFPGTGIGLATVQRVIRRHGGFIFAEGEVGKGAVFYFSFDGYAVGREPALRCEDPLPASLS